MTSISDIPIHTWNRRFDEKEPDSSVHSPSIPPWYDIVKLLPIAYRIRSYVNHERSHKREPIFDLNGLTLQPPNPGPYAGVPLGGIGCGSIGRGYRGEFRRWSLYPGKYIHKEITANVFSLRIKRGNGKIESIVLSMMNGKDDQNLSCLNQWNWNPSTIKSCGTYYALFPFAWTVYEDPLPNLRVIIKQVSPFLSHNYPESSLPCGIFSVEVENKSTIEDIEVSIMFSFQNGLDADCLSSDSNDRSFYHFRHSTFSTSSEDSSTSPSIPSTKPNSRETIHGVTMQHYSSKTYVQPKDEHYEESSNSSSMQESNRSGKLTSTASNSNPFLSYIMGDGDQSIEKKINDSHNLSIGGKSTPSNHVTYCTQFTTKPYLSSSSTSSFPYSCFMEGDVPDFSKESASADDLWLEFHNTGDISDRKVLFPSEEPDSGSEKPLCERRYGSAICIRQKISAARIAKEAEEATISKKKKNVELFEFSLSWDYPFARFGNGKALPKFYTKFFPSVYHHRTAESENDSETTFGSSSLAVYGLLHWKRWEKEIKEWQASTISAFQQQLSSLVTTDESSPAAFSLTNVDYYFYHLFNELYYLVDGGTLWLDSSSGQNNQQVIEANDGDSNDANPTLLSPPSNLKQLVVITENQLEQKLLDTSIREEG
jgi:hypothetical protein